MAVQSSTKSSLDRPLLAVWRDSDGNKHSPKLRVAVWNNGLIMFTTNAPKWSTNLFLAELTANDVESLKQRVRATGVMELDQTSYLMPDEQVCCVLLDFGLERQMLYWNEAGLNYYWNEQKPVYGELPKGDFKRCWAQVNRLALDLVSKKVPRTEVTFTGAPSSWYIRQP